VSLRNEVARPLHEIVEREPEDAVLFLALEDLATRELRLEDREAQKLHAAVAGEHDRSVLERDADVPIGRGEATPLGEDRLADLGRPEHHAAQSVAARGHLAGIELPAAEALDDAGARTLFEKAAAQGHSGALERMGAFAEAGRGGPKDSSAAKAYYEKAAALGNEDAKAALKRAQCPIVLKDKRGNLVGNLCF